MRYSLDTNVVAALIHADASVLNKWKEVRLEGHKVSLNALSYFEVRRGLDLPRFARKFAAFQQLLQMHEVLPLNMAALDISAHIYQDLRRKGTLLEDADILIAGTTLAHGATLVIRNLRHFGRVEGLRLESYEAAAA